MFELEATGATSVHCLQWNQINKFRSKNYKLNYLMVKNLIYLRCKPGSGKRISNSVILSGNVIDSKLAIL
jgi:hypothetical protein